MWGCGASIPYSWDPQSIAVRWSLTFAGDFSRPLSDADLTGRSFPSTPDSGHSETVLFSAAATPIARPSGLAALSGWRGRARRAAQMELRRYSVAGEKR